MQVTKKETEDEITELQSFDYDLLTGSQKYTYDVIKDYLDLNLESYDYTYLYEPFAYTSGLQTNMPINMSEYKFYNEGDVQDYLALLGQLSDYYGKYLDLNRQRLTKAFHERAFRQRGLFASVKNSLQLRKRIF